MKKFLFGGVTIVLALALLLGSRVESLLGADSVAPPVAAPAATAEGLPAFAGVVPADAVLAAAGLVDADGVIGIAAVGALLAEIPVDDAAPHGTYDRDSFGQRWADVNRNGCDTRNDILARDLVDVVFKEGTRDCVVLAGTLHDPYSGVTLVFTRGEGTSEDVPIDHVVSLSWAFQNGADAWDPATREQFANDPLNLQATTRAENTSKLDHGPSEWMPTASGYRCGYVARFLLITATYKLTIPSADATAAAAVLDQCATAPAPN